jgi:hypothetical protein
LEHTTGGEHAVEQLAADNVRSGACVRARRCTAGELDGRGRERRGGKANEYDGAAHDRGADRGMDELEEVEEERVWRSTRRLLDVGRRRLELIPQRVHIVGGRRRRASRGVGGLADQIVGAEDGSARLLLRELWTTSGER